MGLVGFNNLIHFDVLLWNAKCTILVLNMRWDKIRYLHSLNLIDQEPEVSTDWYLAENASGYEVHWPPP